VLKRLIVDRGFLDGEKIGHCKRDLGIDVLIPARRDLEIYKDVVGLAEGGLLQFQAVPVPSPRAPAIPVHRPEKIRKREEARQRTLAKRKAEAAQKTQEVQKVRTPSPLGTPSPERARSEVAAAMDLKTLTTCPVPIHAVVNREIYSDGHREHWVLLDTAAIPEPLVTRQEYGLRTSIEERHRQLKCFSDLAGFTSRRLSLVVNQVVFVLLMYSLPTAVVLATDPTAGIQSANHGSCLGATTADDDRDPDLLSGLCGTTSSTRISGVVADAGGGGASKNIG